MAAGMYHRRDSGSTEAWSAAVEPEERSAIEPEQPHQQLGIDARIHQQ
jgi:hypothetical protein